MKTRILTIANHKGGVAKTTTAFNLSKGLARQNKKVLCIDLDPQGNLTTLTGLDKDDDQIKTKCIASIFRDKNTDIKNLILQVDNIYIIPSNSTLQEASEILTGQPNGDYRLDIKLKELDGLFDYIIIDTPPSISNLARNGIIASTEIITPIQAEYLAEHGTADFLDFFNKINDQLNEIGKPSKTFNGALITLYDKRTNINKGIAEQIKKELADIGINTFNTIIARNTKIAEAQTENKSIFDYDIKSQGATDYSDLTTEIINQE